MAEGSLLRETLANGNSDSDGVTGRVKLSKSVLDRARWNRGHTASPSITRTRPLTPNSADASTSLSDSSAPESLRKIIEQYNAAPSRRAARFKTLDSSALSGQKSHLDEAIRSLSVENKSLRHSNERLKRDNTDLVVSLEKLAPYKSRYSASERALKESQRKLAEIQEERDNLRLEIDALRSLLKEPETSSKTHASHSRSQSKNQDKNQSYHFASLIDGHTLPIIGIEADQKAFEPAKTENSSLPVEKIPKVELTAALEGLQTSVNQVLRMVQRQSFEAPGSQRSANGSSLDGAVSATNHNVRHSDTPAVVQRIVVDIDPSGKLVTTLEKLMDLFATTAGRSKLEIGETGEANFRAFTEPLHRESTGSDKEDGFREEAPSLTAASSPESRIEDVSSMTEYDDTGRIEGFLEAVKDTSPAYFNDMIDAARKKALKDPHLLDIMNRHVERMENKRS